MRAISLEYHDVVPREEADSSGFSGEGPASYKLDPKEFERHLAIIKGVIKGKPATVLGLIGETKRQFPVLLTFDDGGSSAYTYIADQLERFGYCGHFMITVNYIGRPSFLGKEQIRTLRTRGHIIGSHSCSHPKRMSHCSWGQLIEEWRTSVDILSDILDEKVNVASLPGGYYSEKAVQAASEVGIKVMFTSEPTTRCRYVNGCLVLGRYSVRRWTSAEKVKAIASGQVGPRMKQWFFWNLKKIPKFLGGDFYERTREYLWTRRKRIPTINKSVVFL